MAMEDYRLYYENREDVVYSSQSGMRRYLEAEQKTWSPFLEYLVGNLGGPLTSRSNGHSWTSEDLGTAIDGQLSLLDDRDKFNRATLSNAYSRGRILPPPSNSLEGELILGLFDVNLEEDALAAYIFLVASRQRLRINEDDAIHHLIERGRILVRAAPIVKALPYSRVSTSKLSGAVRVAENHVQTLADEIVKANKTSAAHEVKLQAQLDEQKQKAKRVNDIILRLNRRRDRQHRKWLEATGKIVEEKFKDAHGKLRIFEINSQRLEKERVAEFDRLRDLFATKLQFDEPTTLWEGRETQHNRQSFWAMWRFIVIGLVAIVFALAVPYFWGDYIANSFSQLVCSSIIIEGVPSQECERVFSAKGPLTVTGLLLVMSVLMWIARLQYRVHLSERHLALDASEKKAFAATYLAMREGRSVGGDSEAIVLASLFRPTQDGIIRDDEQGMDISALTLMAKHMRGNP
jgi:hypothetical protein